MNFHSKQGLFPLFSLLAGSLGFALRCWLLSAIDDRGLLPHNHFAGILCFVLLAAALAFTFWQVRKTAPSKAYRKLFPASPIAAAGIVVGALGMGFSAFTVKGSGLFTVIVPVLGVLCALALVYAAYCRLKGLRPSYLAYCAAVVYLILRTLLYCRSWGSESQLQMYFFSLLGILFLLIACFYRAELTAMTGDYRRYVFFAQGALFCCMLCLPGKNWLFYLSVVVWMAADFCQFPTPKADE